MSRSDYHKLKTYNTHFKGEILGPSVPANTPSMKRQYPLYPKQKTGYNALTFNGNDREYYKMGSGSGSRGSGPYGLECSVNGTRNCAGGPPIGPLPPWIPIEGYTRENYEATPQRCDDASCAKKYPDAWCCRTGKCAGQCVNLDTYPRACNYPPKGDCPPDDKCCNACKNLYACTCKIPQGWVVGDPEPLPSQRSCSSNVVDACHMKIPCDPGRDESWITADCKAAGAPSGATATAA